MAAGSVQDLSPESGSGSQKDDRDFATAVPAMRPRVLVVDDNLNIVELLTRALTFTGYVVDQAPDAHTAYRKVAQHRPDVVVMDVMLPGEDGFTVVAQLRRDGFQQPVLYVTALDLDEDRQNWIASAGDGYLRKPFAVSELREALARLLAAAGRDR